MRQKYFHAAGIAGVLRQAMPEMLRRLVAVSGIAAQDAQIIMACRHCRAWIRKACSKPARASPGSPRGLPDIAEIVVRIGIVRLERERTLIARRRFLQLALRPQHNGQIVVKIRHLAAGGNGLGDQIGCPFRLAGTKGLYPGGMQERPDPAASAVRAGEEGWRIFCPARRSLRFILGVPMAGAMIPAVHAPDQSPVGRRSGTPPARPRLQRPLAVPTSHDPAGESRAGSLGRAARLMHGSHGQTRPVPR